MFAFNFQKFISISILLGINSANRAVIRNEKNNIKLMSTNVTTTPPETVHAQTAWLGMTSLMQENSRAAVPDLGDTNGSEERAFGSGRLSTESEVRLPGFKSQFRQFPAVRPQAHRCYADRH